MSEDKPAQLPEKDKGYTILQRRKILLGQLKCPACGCGRMPDSRYCLSCGAELPEIQRTESPETVAQRQWQARVLNGFVDLVPGVTSSKVVVCSLLVLLTGVMGAWFAFWGMSGGGLTAALVLPLCVAIAFFSFCVYVLGLVWLLYGTVCSPIELVEALASFRLKHWMTLITLTALGAGVVSWIL